MTFSKSKRGIQVVGPTERIVDRALLKRVLFFPWRLRRGVKLQPCARDGQPVGYKIRALRSNHPLYALGARKGDVIQSVNGYKLRSASEAMGALKALRSERELKFTVTRKGAQIEFLIHIR